jgi:predicted metal-dependent hydrolase
LIDPRLEEFVRLFNHKEFFDAHEVLEALWLESLPPVKDFYKGLIQCAVAFVHLQRKNLRGAKKLFLTSCGYLSHYPAVYEHVKNQKLIDEFTEFFNTIVWSAETSAKAVDVANEQTPMITFSEGFN